MADPDRRAAGRYYTPAPLARALAEDTVGQADGEPRVLDPACGEGALLLAALDVLVERLPPSRRALAPSLLHGVDLDARALAVARAALSERARFHGLPAASAAAASLVQADALDAHLGTFDAVIANPPWGQKAMSAPPARRRELVARFPSAAGIFDWFRPFVELGVRALRAGGWFGMVLPDIVLLKNYEPTRRLLLDELAIGRISHHGLAFDGATIDAVTLTGRRAVAASDHRIAVRDGELAHGIPQAAFRSTPRATFNLRLTDELRRALDALGDRPRLGEQFEVHEGVHSGNCRADLFVNERVDDSCRPILVRGAEVTAFRVDWRGGWLRASAAPRRGEARYANLGRPEWFERPRVVVRRTGDRIIAAVDREPRHASNNFFVVQPRAAADADLDALCAHLNSPFATWWFRAVEPRAGRAFAELKIKHLVDLPLPPRVSG